MSIDYNTLFLFYNDINNLCKPNEYNLVLHKHLGDVFYTIALKDEFERTFGKKLHFIVRPQHAFLMKMFGFDNYSVYDLDQIVKKNITYKQEYFDKNIDNADIDCLENNTFQALFHCVPIIGKPFVCENLFYFFINYPHFWCFRWLKNLGLDDKLKFSIPTQRLTLHHEVLKKLENISTLDKIVLFAPEAATATELAPEFWNIIADKVHAKGYKIIVNSKKYKINHGICAFDLGLSLEDVVALGLNCAYVFSLRSGLCDVLVGAGKRLYAIYPAMLKREINSLSFPFIQNTGVNEILLQNWNISQFIWEDMDFTPDLQKYIDSMKRNYFMEKIKYIFAIKKDKEEHKFWYMLFKNIFDVSKIFPDNNIDNEMSLKQEHLMKKIHIGQKLYKLDIEFQNNGGFNKKYYILGGIVRYKENERHCWKLSVLGIPILRYNKKKLKLFNIPIFKYSWREKWLQKIQRNISPNYDDIYILRHNMGESFVELMFLKERIKAQKSKRPLLIAWKPYQINLYKMFLSNEIDICFVKLNQSDIHEVFSEDLGNTQDVLIKYNGQRFFCSTPRIAENMLLHNKQNFFSYIKKCCRIPNNAKIKSPLILQSTKINTEKKIAQIKLKPNFVLLCPEASSLKNLPIEFWENIVKKLQEKNYDILINTNSDKYAFEHSKLIFFDVDETFYLASKAKHIITLGSGLSVLLTATKVPMDILYTSFKNKKIGYSADMAIKKYSVFHLPNISKKTIKEYNTETEDLQAISKKILNNIL